MKNSKNIAVLDEVTVMLEGVETFGQVTYVDDKIVTIHDIVEGVNREVRFVIVAINEIQHPFFDTDIVTVLS